MSAKLSKRIRFSKVGDEIVVPMGMYLPHCVKLYKIYTDEEGQIVGEGYFIFHKECSTWRMGEFVSVCLGWK